MENRERIENLKKILKLEGTEHINSLRLTHEDFTRQYCIGKVTYKLPKRYINVFYVLPIERWRQIIAQIFLLSMWAGYLLGVVMLFKKDWIFALLAFIGGWTIKQFCNFLH